eukprot:g3611.t1
MPKGTPSTRLSSNTPHIIKIEPDEMKKSKRKNLQERNNKLAEHNKVLMIQHVDDCRKIADLNEQIKRLSTDLSEEKITSQVEIRVLKEKLSLQEREISKKKNGYEGHLERYRVEKRKMQKTIQNLEKDNMRYLNKIRNLSKATQAFEKLKGAILENQIQKVQKHLVTGGIPKQDSCSQNNAAAGLNALLQLHNDDLMQQRSSENSQQFVISQTMQPNYASHQTNMQRLLTLLSSSNLFASGLSQVATAFNLANTNIVILLLRFDALQLSTENESLLSILSLVGAVCGQLFFAFAGDTFGRKRCLLACSVLQILGCLVASFAPTISFLILARFVLGIGIGGVYPLTATLAAESSKDSSHRGRDMATVFLFQGIGFMLVPLIALIALLFCRTEVACNANMSSIINNETTAIGGEANDGTHPSLSCHCFGTVWRLLLGLGALPLIYQLCFIKVKETSKPRGTQDAFQNARHAFRKPEVRQTLIGTAIGWFLFDLVFYGNSLFSSLVINTLGIGGGESTSVLGHVNAVVFVALLISIVALPGYIMTVVRVEEWGRKKIQIFGFTFLSLTFGVCGIIAFSVGQKMSSDIVPLFLIIYAASFFFSNFGPNPTTYILSSESYPKEVRSTFAGISAASGKLGGALGGFVFDEILNIDPNNTLKGLGIVLVLCCVVSILGVWLTQSYVKDLRGVELDSDRPGVEMRMLREEDTKTSSAGEFAELSDDNEVA